MTEGGQLGGRIPRRGLGGVLANLALLACSMTAFLLIAEAGARTFSRIGPALLVTDPVIGKRYVARFEGRVFVDEVGDEVPLRFNREGFRGPDWPRSKPEGGCRVAVIGDSMIASIAAPEERTLVYMLESALRRARAPQPVEVLNFGVSSSSTGQELALYRNLASGYAPDLVVLAFFVGNDFADNSRRLTQARRIYFDFGEDGVLEQVSAPSAPSAASRWLNLHSRFYTWQKLAVRLFRGSTRELAGGVHPGLRVFELSDDPDLAHAWALLVALLREFRAEVEDDGSRMALVIVPSADQIHDELWAAIRAGAADAGRTVERFLPQRRIAELAEAEGIALLDLTPPFLETVAGRSADEPGSPYLHGRYHFSDLGSRLAADQLLRFVTAKEGYRLLSGCEAPLT